MPCLYVVPTPIGNLEDITLRALRVLRGVDLVLAEDTRHTRTLLTHYGISCRLLSYHQHNKVERLDEAIATLQHGDVALVSNAGMPAIADPGFELILAAVTVGIEIDVLPGPSAVITAVVGAALPSTSFLFDGFLPRRRGDRLRRLHELRDLRFSLVFYEAPHRLTAALRDIREELGDRNMVVARELTKVHQEYARGTAGSLLENYEKLKVRGECTLVIGGAEPPAMSDVLVAAGAELRRRKDGGEDRRTAVGAVAHEYLVGRNDLYRLWLGLEKQSY